MKQITHNNIWRTQTIQTAREGQEKHQQQSNQSSTLITYTKHLPNSTEIRSNLLKAIHENVKKIHENEKYKYIQEFQESPNLVSFSEYHPGLKNISSTGEIIH